MDEKLKILIIGDDEAERTTICRAFTDAGAGNLKVVESNNAIDALKNVSYDCVFLDSCLSDIEGLSLLRELRSLEISVPIVVIVENSYPRVTAELMEAGATDYIRKSILSAEILDVVTRNAIAIYQAQTQLAVANKIIQQNKQLIISKSQKNEQQKQQIDLQNLKLIEALQLKSQFLATISHELRTPMNAIIGFSQLLLRPKCGVLSCQQKDMVERILNNAKNLLMLLNEILEFSKLQAGKLDLKPEILDLSKLVNATVMEMGGLARDKQLSVEVDINLQNNILYNDSRRLEQILKKLFSNAIKFTPIGTIRVKIEELANNRILLEVEDTGIGIAADNIQHIFEPFRQIEQGTNRRFGGTGLGLPIVSALVNMMGGKITVESELGKGSRFCIELPRQVSSALDNDIIAANYDSQSQELINKKRDYIELQFKKQHR
ncbi:hybrid sensor histidine kinase/response regulator [Rivularia sp. UHCC 0363]|uniref:ATP-binding response regulator n=1 Tax=Rivularia sp. UHCC 0363 TaxID=3110244 RepID=UPI002B206F32|nr:ATP-binding protein [Rivularia sp. UHCC 0363]MEA5598682.1 ATP-binding protein [Rivularia sp. UHCC 0363]